jgi:aspartyl-tRNA synthetase
MTDPKRFAKDYPALSEKVLAFTKIAAEDLWLLAGAADKPENVAVMGQDVQHFCEKCGFLRLDLAQKYASKHKAFERTGDVEKDYRFLWVSDFPMFEWDKEEKRWNPAHHPFTTLHEEDFAKLDANINTVFDPTSPLGEIRALAYDVVLNGTELGSGSIRIHRQDVQKKIFQALGMSDAEAKARFGFFLEALEFGTPPHGGIALGLDRIVMILAGAESLREVIPFPKTARAVDLMVDAPSPASEKQLKELGIVIRKAAD